MPKGDRSSFIAILYIVHTTGHISTFYQQTIKSNTMILVLATMLNTSPYARAMIDVLDDVSKEAISVAASALGARSDMVTMLFLATMSMGVRVDAMVDDWIGVLERRTSGVVPDIGLRADVDASL